MKHCIVEGFDGRLLCFRVSDSEGCRICVDNLVLLSPSVTYTLDREQRVLRTAIAFFFDPELLLPKAVVDGEFLLDRAEFKALAIAQAPTIAELFQCRLDSPLQLGRRLFGASAKEDVVLDLQPPDVVIELGEFFVDRHSGTQRSPGPQLRPRTIA